MKTTSINKTIHSSVKASAAPKGSKIIKASVAPKAKAASNFASKQAMAKSYGIGKSNTGKGMSNFVVLKGNSVKGKGTGYTSKKA